MSVTFTEEAPLSKALSSICIGPVSYTHLDVYKRQVIDLGVVLVGTCGEVDLWLDDVVERHRIALSLLACLVRV